MRTPSMKTAAILFSALFLSIAVSPAERDLLDLRVISLDSARLTAESSIIPGLDVLTEKNGRLYIVSSFRDRENLDALGIQYLDEPAYSGLPTPLPASASGGLNGDYHSYAELERDLRALEAAHPGLAKVFVLGQSLEGRNIYGLKISDNVGLDEDEARTLFLGCHHAREWISVEVPFLLGRHLLENYATDARVRAIVDRSEVWIVPLVNPDGLEYSIHVYRYWRKNRRDNGDGNFGVDLNRNYAYEWGRDNTGSSPSTESAVYRGAASFSEPEARAVGGLVDRTGPLALVSYHSYAQSIIYPWGYAQIPLDGPGAERTIALAEGMAFRMAAYRGTRYIQGQSSFTSYLVNGDTTDWAYGVHGIPAYTIELSPQSDQGGGFFNAETEILPVFYDNLEPALYLIEDCVAVHVPAGRDGREADRRRPSSDGGDRVRR